MIAAQHRFIVRGRGQGRRKQRGGLSELHAVVNHGGRVEAKEFYCDLTAFGADKKTEIVL